jgi:adenosylcobyric acid synthase
VKARTLMVQGTMSNAGKSVVAAGLCRLFARKGLRVAPFKAQNMSNNSFATLDGGEIGRAQAVQGAAAMAIPDVRMNPILLKPEADHRSQVVVLGKAIGSATAREYYAMKLGLWPKVTAALDALREEYDLVIIEGAGSPAEINLREHEIVNMRVARYAHAPVLLVGDIDRGGVFASLVGTMELLEPEERALVKGYIINKFRGDSSLLDSGLDMLLKRTGVPTIGVLPHFTDIHIPEEDSLGLERRRAPAAGPIVDVVVVRLPHIANFDDFDPLSWEPGVRLRYVEHSTDWGSPDLAILPGSKTTIADLHWLSSSGLAACLASHRERGGAVIGICAGYQMLGRNLSNPLGLEGGATLAKGLDMLHVDTEFHPRKITTQTHGRVAIGYGLLSFCGEAEVSGYEIHTGLTRTPADRAPFRLRERSGAPMEGTDGSLSEDGRVLGTYLHGLFHNRPLRRGILKQVAAWKGASLPDGATIDQDAEFDKLAGLLEAHLDMDQVWELAGLRGSRAPAA